MSESSTPPSALAYVAAAVRQLAPERSQSFNTTEVANLALKMNEAALGAVREQPSGIELLWQPDRAHLQSQPGGTELLQAARVGYSRLAQGYQPAADDEDDEGELRETQDADDGEPIRQPDGRSRPRMTRAIRADAAGQRDFAEYGDPKWGWVRERVSYDDYGNRLEPLYMNYYQFKSRVELLARQAASHVAAHRQAELLLERYAQDWMRHPERLLGYFVGVLDAKGKPAARR